VEGIRRDRDCLLAFSRRVTDADLLSGGDLEAIDDEVASLIDEAVDEAKAAADPTVAEVLTDVYVRY